MHHTTKRQHAPAGIQSSDPHDNSGGYKAAVAHHTIRQKRSIPYRTSHYIRLLDRLMPCKICRTSRIISPQGGPLTSRGLPQCNSKAVPDLSQFFVRHTRSPKLQQRLIGRSVTVSHPSQFEPNHTPHILSRIPENLRNHGHPRKRT